MEDQSPHQEIADSLASRSAEAIREMQARAHATFSARRDQISRLEQQIDQQLTSIETLIADECASEAAAKEAASQIQAELDQARAELAGAQAAWEQERKSADEAIAIARQQNSEQETKLAERESLLQERDEELCQREQTLELRVKELAELEQSQAEKADFERILAEREETWEALRAGLEAERQSAATQVEQLAAEHRQAQETWTAKIAELEQNRESLQAKWNSDRAELDAARANVEEERDKLAHELLASREKLKSFDELADAAGERDELKQKFELALEDVQRLRASIAELELERSQRLEQGTAESAEVERLRSERDALAARVDSLEERAEAAVDGDQSQALADLQRRFEMAVEDVRELKTKNAELESRLGAARKSAAGCDDGNGMDWESQKRRLLASLEDESGEVDDAREEERVSIKDTIEMTDAVVAEKDGVIADLRAQLEAQAAALQVEAAPAIDPIEPLIDADEVISRHRERSAQLEKELEEKLREAELELSVERAKLARDKAEVEEWRLEMEAFKRTRAADEPATPAGAPRRRWLSKLGLNGDEKS